VISPLESELKNVYESLAQTLDYKTTACDYNLRELEIDAGDSYICDGDTVLDIGCGLGYAAIEYASRKMVTVVGIDYSNKMIEGANKLYSENKPKLRGTVEFKEATVLKLPFQARSFDIVTSSRCLMALLDWEKQKQAIKEVHRVLKSGGVFVMMEGTLDGLEKLNKLRVEFRLDPIKADGRDRLFTLKFDEKKLLGFCKPLFAHERTQRFGMYYFLTRVVQPLLVHPEKPSYDHRLNEVAKQISKIYPDFKGLGHLVAFIFSKRR